LCTGWRLPVRSIGYYGTPCALGRSSVSLHRFNRRYRATRRTVNIRRPVDLALRTQSMEKRALILKLTFLLGLGCSSHDGPVYPAAGSLPMGGACYSAYDCATGFCCTSPPCHGGMCTYACRTDLDCPYGTRCDGGACFAVCFYDSDCAYGQTCKKAHSLCQY